MEKIRELIYGSRDCSEINIPEGVAAIPDGAFRECKALRALTLPSSIRRIGHGIFEGLSDIDVYFGGGAEAFREMTENIREERPVYHEGKYDHQPYNSGVGSYYTYEPRDIRFDYRAKNIRVHTADGEVAYYHISLTVTGGVLNLPASVRRIDSDTVINKEELTELRIPEGVTSIGNDAFSYATGLREVYLPDSLESIDYRAFYCCSSLTSIRLPEGLRGIGEEAFYYCKSLREINLPESLTYIGRSALQEVAITEARLPLGITCLGDNAFFGCPALTRVEILSELRALPRGGFENCASLTEITLPEHLRKVEDHAFSGCTSLKRIFFTGDEMPKFKKLALKGTPSDLVIEKKA